MDVENILVVGGILFGVIGAWDTVLLPQLESLPSNVQNAALNIGINPVNAFIPTPSSFSPNFWWEVGGGLVASGLALKYGSPILAIVVAVAAVFLLWQDYQNSGGGSSIVEDD